MNKEQFLNKEIINKNNERGLAVSFDDEHIVIKYENEGEFSGFVGATPVTFNWTDYIWKKFYSV